MSNTYRPIPPIATSSLDGFVQPVTALSFDPVSDILWAGLNSGTITSYFGSRGVRGPSFRVGGNLAVKKITSSDNSLQAFGDASEGLGSWAKGGVNKWFYRPDTNVVTFANTASSHNLAVSLAGSELAFLSPMTGTCVRRLSTTSLLTQLEFSHSILLSGSIDGFLRVQDPRTGLARSNGSEHFVKAHARSVQGLQTIGNFVFSIGMGERQGRPFPDPLVKVYDLRTMSALPPIPFSAGPAFIHAVPTRTSSLVIISNQGLINVVDASNSASNEFYQLDVPTCITSTAISQNAAYLAFGDADGTIHLLSEPSDSEHFNGFEGQPLPWADRASPLPEIKWTKSTPLNSIGMPYFDTQLLSAWPTNLSSRTTSYPPPQKIPPQILATMKFNENIAYATLPKELRGRRNVANSEPRRGPARFRSGKTILDEVCLCQLYALCAFVELKQPESDNIADHEIGEVPRMYRRVEIEYSKFGVEDFDFGFYNTTDFSGLETHILNSYTNSLVQVMHYITPIRQLAKAHITENCPREHCLLCELGFISRMLEDAAGINCQASNFCKTVGVLAQASNAIEIIDYGREGKGIDYVQKIQAFHRFLVDHLNSEGNNYPRNPYLLASSPRLTPAASPITQLLGIDGKNHITCSACKRVREKNNMVHVVDLIYPNKVGSNDQSSLSFVDIVTMSLFRQMTHKATCPSCKHFSTFVSRRSISSQQLPPILAINAAVSNDEIFGFWKDTKHTTFLQPCVALRGQVGGVDEKEEVLYDIRAMIVRISSKEDRSHLVAVVKVPAAEEQEAGSPWFLFNDFVVKNISQEEALSFPDKWKCPAVIYLERVDNKKSLAWNDLKYELDQSILSRDTSISINRDPALVKHEFLQYDERPKPGTLVAIDAEFVSMQQEETEFRSDGTKKVLRPARLSLARVSVLRGSGLREGVPFIDDHIHTSEVIVDYLTEFSGIKFGDLDPLHSKYTLTPLKLVYKKLRLLVDAGCIFVGHGLSKDFRIINIFVPPEQVIDTVDLYFLRARQRRLSLRFLAWFVLGEHIQTETHDSIEDARTALRLYNAYQTFEADGVFDQKLDEIYREGRQFGFKPPALTEGESGASPMTSYSLSQATSMESKFGS